MRPFRPRSAFEPLYRRAGAIVSQCSRIAAGLLAVALLAAPAPETVPASARRPFEVRLAPGRPAAAPVAAELPPGFAIETAAEAPLVTHPIMACLGPGRSVFVGDAVGVNWNKAQLEAAPPNRILRLEDLDGDGRFDRSTVFADGLTFPQGALWHDGSLFVCTPPGLIRLTDTDGDGIADRREVLVSGFDYTGNAADVHGPFLGPRDQLYFCHGRKGHKATDRDGKVVHEGQAAGIWRCDPDGRHLEWFVLGAGDNPVEVAFGPWGEAFATYNLYYSQPRGDTVLHLQDGAVHPRADLPQVTAGEPRTIAHQPVAHNFGHVAVSGATFWKQSAGFDGGARPLQLMVTHFNTGRMVRLELAAQGPGWKAREHDFLRLTKPDTHLTDVLEDEDGSLLVLDTGGWFRLGCPSSLLAKPEALGRLYRIRPTRPMEAGAAWTALRLMGFSNHEDLISGDGARIRAACERLKDDFPADPKRPELREEIVQALSALLDAPLEPEAEHAFLRLLQHRPIFANLALDEKMNPRRLRRLLIAQGPIPRQAPAHVVAAAARQLASTDADLAATAREIVLAQETLADDLRRLVDGWLRAPEMPAEQIAATTTLARGFLRLPEARAWVTAMLAHPSPTVRTAALDVLANQNLGVKDDAWLAPLERRLAEGPDAATIEAVRRLREPKFDAALGRLVAEVAASAPLRLRAWEAMTKRPDSAAAFGLALNSLTDSSFATRLQAAKLLGAASPTPEQAEKLSAAALTLGVMELRELLPVARRLKPSSAEGFARALTRNPALAGIQESVLRTHFQGQPPEVFDGVLAPAYRALGDADVARRIRLEKVADLAARGDVAKGRALFAEGRGACVGCHRVGDLGRRLGPDLTTIGGIRTPRDLAESILYPSRTLARDHETQAFELRDGRTLQGLIRSHVAEGLLIADAGGQETLLRHADVVSRTTLPESLMPQGLDAAFSDQELADLIAWLRSLR